MCGWSEYYTEIRANIHMDKHSIGVTETEEVVGCRLSLLLLPILLNAKYLLQLRRTWFVSATNWLSSHCAVRRQGFKEHPNDNNHTTSTDGITMSPVR